MLDVFFRQQKLNQTKKKKVSDPAGVGTAMGLCVEMLKNGRLLRWKCAEEKKGTGCVWKKAQ